VLYLTWTGVGKGECWKFSTFRHRREAPSSIFSEHQTHGKLL
jgi:hypothetical protein